MRCVCAWSSSSWPISWARRVARCSPSAAATIELFIRIFYRRAKASGIGYSGVGGEVGDEFADAGQVVAASHMYQVRRLGDLEKHVDERAALEVGAQTMRRR